MKSATRKRAMVLVGLTLIAVTIAAVAAWQRFPFDGSANTTHTQSSDNKSRDKQAPTLSEDKSVAQPVSGKSVAAPVQAQSAIHQPPATTAEPLPPAGTPWHQVLAALMDRAQAGDKAASDRLYDDTFGCIQYTFVLGSARERLRNQANIDKMSVGQIIRDLDSYGTMQSILRDNGAACSNVTRDELFEQMYPILLAAAQNGNERAAACYAFGPYEPPRSDSDNNEAALTDWAHNATEFMLAGTRRGDWKMVILTRMYLDPATQEFATSYDSNWAAQLFEPDPLIAYRYAALRAIGANADDDEAARDRTSRMLVGYRERYKLSNAQVHMAENWAQSTYRQYFAGLPWVGINDVNWCAH